jgi:hypothetical protein
MAMNAQLSLKVVDRQWDPPDQKAVVNPSSRRLTQSMCGVQSVRGQLAPPARRGPKARLLDCFLRFCDLFEVWIRHAKALMLEVVVVWVYAMPPEEARQYRLRYWRMIGVRVVRLMTRLGNC